MYTPLCCQTYIVQHYIGVHVSQQYCYSCFSKWHSVTAVTCRCVKFPWDSWVSLAPLWMPCSFKWYSFPFLPALCMYMYMCTWTLYRHVHNPFAIQHKAFGVFATQSLWVICSTKPLHKLQLVYASLCCVWEREREGGRFQGTAMTLSQTLELWAPLWTPLCTYTRSPWTQGVSNWPTCKHVAW